MAEDVFGIVGSLQAAVFRVERVVAEGGSGVVYRAQHEGFNAAVALKCLELPGAFTAEQRQAFFHSFQELGELLFRLSTLLPCVVRPLHVGLLQSSSHPFVPFIALDWLEGESLASLVARRRAVGKPPLELGRVARLMGPVARGLERAHRLPGLGGARASVVHGALEPKNLFLAQAHGIQTLKLLNLGVRALRSAATPVGDAALAASTSPYGAPEQRLPQRYGPTGPWTDVWGFALCAVEALSGRVPLQGDVPALMNACLDEQQRPTPLALGVKLPDRAEAAFRRALAVDPAQRFQDLGQFWDELEAASGVLTPRLAQVAPSEDSLPPPFEAGGFTLGSDVPSLPAPPPRRLPAGPSLVDDGDDDDMRISVMRGGSLDQLERAEPAASPRGPLPELVAVGREEARRHRRSETPSVSSVFTRLKPGLLLVGAGAAVMLADVAYSALSGQSFTLGPARAVWLAGPLVGLGLVRVALSLGG